MPEQLSFKAVPAAVKTAPAPVVQAPVAETVTHIPSEAPRVAEVTDQKSAVEAPALPAGEKPAPTPEQTEKRGQSRFERRLDKAYRQRAEAEAKAEFLERQLSELRKPAPVEGEPKLEHFDYDPEKYATAKADFVAKQKVKELEVQRQSESQKEMTQRLTSGWEEKVAKADVKYEDFDEVVGELQPNSPVVIAIMDAENGEDIAYYLGKHIDEAKRIANLPPFSQMREIGKLEAKLLSEPVKPKTPSQAPAPIKPLSGAAAAPTDQPSDEDNLGDWLRKRSKQVHRR